jgi:hypothetical protein
MSERFPGGAALRWLEEEFGGSISEAESTPATGAGSATFTGNDPDAVGLIVINLGANDVFIGLSSKVALNNGIKLTANGGACGFTVRDDGTLPTREWWAISPGGVSTLYALRIRLQSLIPGAL